MDNANIDTPTEESEEKKQIKIKKFKKVSFGF